VEAAAREEIIKNGGSISHHHGVGRIRKEFTDRVISKQHQNILRAVKKELDPKHIFGLGNTINFNMEGHPSSFKSETGGHW
jgi:alkyldihydroxyacetonephosphate synthase